MPDSTSKTLLDPFLPPPAEPPVPDDGWARRLLSHSGPFRPTLADQELAGAWEEFERSGLLSELHEVCAQINQAAGYTQLYEDCYLPPQPCLRKYTLAREAKQLVMALVITVDGPGLLFCLNDRWENTDPKPLSSPSVNMWFRLDLAGWKREDVRQWFSFLLHGFKDSFSVTRR